MDKQSNSPVTAETANIEKPKRKSIKEFLYTFSKRAFSVEKNDLINDLLLFSVGFLLTRCHIIFGAHPLGLAFVSVLPYGVWPTLLGSVIGSFSMGIKGIIFAVTTVIAVFLRVAISSGEQNCKGLDTLFGESLTIRMSVGTICGFICGVYEVLISGLNQGSLLFGLSMIILTPVLVFIFFGLFSGGTDIRTLIKTNENPFTFNEKTKKERYGIGFFVLSALTLIFFIGFSFKGVNILGISLSYVFASLITILCAKRFGALAGSLVGLASSLGISGPLSVAFSLSGLGAGMLFSAGNVYALTLGGIAISAWSSYSYGLGGLLSMLPEYIVAAAISVPLLKQKENVTKEKDGDLANEGEDMVGTMALVYRSQYSGCADKLTSTLRSMSEVIKDFSPAPEELSHSDYKRIVLEIAECHCLGCDGSKFCAKEDIRPCIKNADTIARILEKNGKITLEDINTALEFCSMAHAIAESINREAVSMKIQNLHARELGPLGQEYGLTAGMIGDALSKDETEQTVDSTLTNPLCDAIKECGLESFTARVFGKRRKYILLATEDAEGAKISSEKIPKSIEDALGIRLGKPNYFRKGKMALMECSTAPKISIRAAMASMPGHANEISGDCASVFDTKDDMCYALISDGMGSGEMARKTSSFVEKLLKTAMEGGADKDSTLHILNRSIKAKGEECSATVDMLELDLLNGKGVFIKCGAPPSYIKRESSIFRIRSQTAPIGLMNSVDAEQTRLELRPGDHIIMLSDGIADERDDAPWLLLLLGERPKENLTDYANLILDEAKKHSKTQDDMTVLVLRVDDV